MLGRGIVAERDGARERIDLADKTAGGIPNESISAGARVDQGRAAPCCIEYLCDAVAQGVHHGYRPPSGIKDGRGSVSVGIDHGRLPAGVVVGQGRAVAQGIDHRSNPRRGIVERGRKITERVLDADTPGQLIGPPPNVRSLIHNVTSYSSAAIGQGTIVNDVQRAYNPFEQVVTEYQEHNGAVNTSTSVNVQYQYANGSSNTIRPTALIYPNGRVLNLSYGTSGAIDDALSRIVSLIDSDGVTHLADYTRIGAHTFVQQASAQPQIAWSLINGTGINPYTGLDQFNRTVDNRWYGTATNRDLERIEHGYDRVGNRLWRRNTVAEGAGVNIDELYGIDGIYRLQSVHRGYLDATNRSIVSGTLNFSQIWGLDATGNWHHFWQNSGGASWDLQQSRAANQLNEITGITGGSWTQPVYDAAGNTVQMPQPLDPAAANDAVYDAWNRPTSVSGGGSSILQNGYDGLMRRVTKLVFGTVRHVYYSGNWQPLEERLGSSSSADRQFVWGLRHIDDLLLRDRGSERFYALQDPNWNVTAICSSTGSIAERYLFSPYGQPTFMNEAFAMMLSSAYAWETLFGGYRWDIETGLYQVRLRALHPALGRWTTIDPVLFGDGLHFFAYVRSSPLTYVDPVGLAGQPQSAPQVHHWLCQDGTNGRATFKRLCCDKGVPVNIDDFTIPLDDSFKGTPHYVLHRGSCDYTAGCKNIYKNATNCCDLLTKFLSHIPAGWACLEATFGAKGLPPFGMRPLRGGPDTFGKLLAHTMAACGPNAIDSYSCGAMNAAYLAAIDMEYEQCVKNGDWFCAIKRTIARNGTQQMFENCQRTLGGQSAAQWIAEHPGVIIVIGGVVIVIVVAPEVLPIVVGGGSGYPALAPN
ncbi:MAG TPA: RHS repeat-associated core domain-containing protein [Pirellulales bacterium]|nr:RHS repeat-associated core domain-containing protein [Pirellulales bacterium]